MLSIRDYAKQRGISYEAARKSVVKYAKELDKHIIKNGKKQFLDSEGVEILDQHRAPKDESIVYEEKKGPTTDELYQTIIQLQQEISRLKDEVALGIAAKTKVELLEANREAEKAEKKALEEKNNQLENKVVLLENEVKSFVPTFFGRYKKVKV